MKSLNFSYELYEKLSQEYFKGFNKDICLKYWKGYKIKPKVEIGLLHYLCKIDKNNEYIRFKKDHKRRDGKTK